MNSSMKAWVTCMLLGLLAGTMVHAGDAPKKTKDASNGTSATQAQQEARPLLYNEPYRSQFHFTAEKNWLNDPNGLVFYKGEYHLFFQHNPKGIEWGNMTWGHAVSPDLLHWKQLPNALEPDPLGTIFSGSAVVDWDNTAGFQQGEEKTLAALYTAAGGSSPESQGQPFTQCLAYSTDRGRTWTKYAKNPVLKHILGSNRDPKVVWHAPTKKWITILYLDLDRFGFYASPNLKQWTPLQEIRVPGCAECPDFFPLRVEGKPDTQKWVWTCATGRYVVGDFDGHKFTPDTIGSLQVEYGKNDYAVQTYSDLPEGRRVQVAWMAGGQFPGMPFNHQMSIPCELTLRQAADGLRMFKEPVKEIEKLHGEAQEWKDLTLKSGDVNPLAKLSGDLFDIRAEIELAPTEAPGKAESPAQNVSDVSVEFTIRGASVVYSFKNKTLASLGASAPLEPANGKITVQILVDRASIEVYGNSGQVALSSCFLPPAADKSLKLQATGGPAKLVSLKVYPLRSAWDNK